MSKGFRLGTQWRALRGCAWGVRQPTLIGHALVSGADWQLDRFDDFMSDLLDERGPASARADAATAVECFLHWYGAIQRGQRVPVFGPGRVLASSVAGSATRFDLALPYQHRTASSQTLDWLARAMNAFMVDLPGARTDAARSFKPLLDTLRALGLDGTNNFTLVQAARRLEIPCRPLLPRTFSLGLGARSRRFQSTLTGATSSLAMQIAHSKKWTAYLLRLHGVEVPMHESVPDAQAAVAAAHKLGYPVVVKPDDQEQGRGVSAGLASDEAVRGAYAVARGFSASVLVEKHHSGEDYRFNVMHGEVIKILHRRPGAVDGDGVNTVAQLLELDLQGRLRKAVRQQGRRILDLDAEALSLLSEQGLEPTDIPASGRRVLLRRKSNISAGGIQTLVAPADVHPDNLALAIDATRAVGLDLCGVDLLLVDVARSWRETGGVVIEVNGMPQIGHSIGAEAYDRIVTLLVEGDGRVPVHLALHAGDDVPLAPLRELATTLGCNAVATAGGVWIDGRQRGTRFASGFDAANLVLLDTTVHGAVIALTAADITGSGLPLDRVTQVHVLGKPGNAASQARLDRALAMIAGHVEAA